MLPPIVRNAAQRTHVETIGQQLVFRLQAHRLLESRHLTKFVLSLQILAHFVWKLRPAARPKVVRRADHVTSRLNRSCILVLLLELARVVGRAACSFV